MLTFEFSASDLARTRFAISPLLEVVTSTSVLRNPNANAVHLPWIKQVREHLAANKATFPLLEALVAPARGYIPDFLSRPPLTSMTDLASELDALRSTSAEQVHADLAFLSKPISPMIAEKFASPREGLAKLAAEVERYWDLALAVHWPRIRRLLEGEVLFRARQLAESGVHGVLGDLGTNMQWTHSELRILKIACTNAVSLRGRGLLLVPSVFARLTGTAISEEPWQPTLIYSPRGVATLWEWGGGCAPEALATVMGKARALLLAELASPASTTELSRWTGLTPGGVSTHLTALRSAGLVSAHRTGRTVLYARTRVAESLLEATA
ncbi:MAG: helix-turn-helix transcriptional regulator [Corynebacteriales bacterium]|nr:helix-turn-helix transcriptional regulator [Mycobacteriales bacterium]